MGWEKGERGVVSVERGRGGRGGRGEGKVVSARGKEGDDSGPLSLALPVRVRYIYTQMAKRPARQEPLVDTPSLIRIMVMAR